MLVESAFALLPESVTGYGFQRVRREANAVGCFAFSLLNALHAKNVLDPIQRLQLEKVYATSTVPLPATGSRRHCDIYLDYGGSKIGSATLANYGWRFRNYVEAKFLKSYKKTRTGQDTHSSSNSAEVVADLLRLAVLVPEPELAANRRTPRTSSARYFLCLSDNPPDIFINKYLAGLHSVFHSPPKTASLTIDLRSGKPNGKFSTRVGAGFGSLALCDVKATCFSHYPLNSTRRDVVWMLLIRLDAATVFWDDNGTTRWFSFDVSRLLRQHQSDDYTKIRDFVATNIK